MFNTFSKENNEDNYKISRQDIEILRDYHISKLIGPYIKIDFIEGFKKPYFINPPNINMVEKTKTAYVNYEDDLKNYFNDISNYYNDYSSRRKFDTFNEFLSCFAKIYEIIKILIHKNKVFLENDCIFQEENNEVFNKIPSCMMEIIIRALSGRIAGSSEVVQALKLLKLASNSSILINEFVDKGGMEELYRLVLNREQINYLVKQMILENIYRLITHRKAFWKLLDNIDKNKLQPQYFMVKENIRDREGFEEPEEEKKESKKNKKKIKNKKYSRNNSPESNSSDDSIHIKRKKKQAKNILLKNGYQIILTLIIGKKNNVIINTIRKILNKIGFQLYLHEIEEASNTLVY